MQGAYIRALIIVCLTKSGLIWSKPIRMGQKVKKHLPSEPVCLSPSIKQSKTYSDCRLFFVVIASHLASNSVSPFCWTGLAMKSLIPA